MADRSPERDGVIDLSTRKPESGSPERHTEGGSTSDLEIVILEDGTIAPRGGASTRMGRDFAGRWRLTPFGRDLAILRPVTAGARSPIAIAIAGEVAAAGGLANVISSIHHHRWSGTLHIHDGLSGREIQFRDGEVRAAMSTRALDRLGQLLYRYGRVSNEEIDRALALARTGRKIGEALVELGAISRPDLFTFVRKQVEEIILSLLKLRDGTFYFSRRESAELPEVSELGLSTQELLLEGARMIDEVAHIRERIPSSEAIPVLAKRSAPTDSLHDDARTVLSLINGRRTVDEIGRESKLGEYEATRVVYQLMQGGYVELRRELVVLNLGLFEEERDSSPLRVIGIFNEMLTTVWRSVQAGTLDAELHAFAESSSELHELFQDVRFDEQGRLPAELLLSNLAALSIADETRYLRKALNELLSYLLFVIGDTGSQPDQDRLRQSLFEATLDLSTTVTERVDTGDVQELQSDDLKSAPGPTATSVEETPVSEEDFLGI